MRIPSNDWAAKPDYQALLYFCQLLDNMVWESTRDSHRAPAMNTYHLCLEVQRTWDEMEASSLREGLVSVVLDELRATGDKDPTVSAHFAEHWSRLTFALKSDMSLETKVGAVARFFRQIETAYLKRCRDEIQRLISGKAAKKEKLAILAGSFCSYLQNVGYTPRHIARMIGARFFSRELDEKPARELQKFFASFSGRPAEFDVLVSVTEHLAKAAGGRDFEEYKGKLPGAARFASSFHPEEETDEKIVVVRGVKALDEFGAVEQAEARMALVRAVAYTARADIHLQWRDDAVVVSSTNTNGFLVQARDEPLRKRYRDHASYQYPVVGEWKRAVLEDQLPTQDANRLKNALLSYANAFHSESPATQLVTLWSALEGLLPSSRGEGRIDTVVRYALACQRSLYLRNRFRWSFLEHLASDRDGFFKLLGEASDYRENLARFVALLCFPKEKTFSDKLGLLAAESPLTTQRGFALHSAAKNVQDLFGLLNAHVQRVDWQLRRIYRERNRIVHRADPSPNVGTLILNLNEYLTTIFEVLFAANESRPYAMGLDGVFEAILLDEQYRAKGVTALGKQPLSGGNADLVLGFALE